MFTRLAALALLALAAAVPTVERRASTGQATYFAVGLGACGWTNTDADFIVAMNAPQYDGGAYCGKTLTITNTANGNTATAEVVDLCPGCASGSLDMSPALFSSLSDGNMDEGVFPISWVEA